jgi:hypothetical protein
MSRPRLDVPEKSASGKSGPGGAASRNSWNTGNSMLFSTLMTGSCRRTFSRKGSTRRIGFAPLRATVTLATGCHLSNTWPRAISWLPRVQTIPNKQLAAVGAKCSSCIRVPYFGVALQCLPGTELVLTLTSGMTSVIKNDRRLRLVKAPQELHAFHFLMAWHPRLNTDPRHVWLREAMRQVPPQEASGQRL